jgi:hypothetical protein
VPPRGWRGPAEAEHAPRRALYPSQSSQSGPQPGARALYVAPSPTSGARPSPCRLRSRFPQSGHLGPGARLARHAAGTPATRCRSAGPLRERRGLRTGPGTSRARSLAGRGGHTVPELGPLAHLTSK